MISRIVLELENPGDSRTMFRIFIDDALVGENLTAVQAHIIVGEALDRITIPRRRLHKQEQVSRDDEGERSATTMMSAAGRD
jgi:hypothetical protein